MIHPNASTATTVRSVFFMDPDKKIRATATYRPSTGRTFAETLRVIDSLKLTDCPPVATPVNWQNGGECVIVASLKDPEALRQTFPASYRELRPYLRWAPQPKS